MIEIAVDADLPGIRAVADHFGLLTAWPDRPDYLDLEHRHGTIAIAKDGGEVIGFAASLRRGHLTHLGDLFVLPSRQSAGIGAALLHAVLPTTGDRITFASADPRAGHLYLRHGLAANYPLLYLAGPLDGLPAGDAVATSAGEIHALDTSASGGDRHQQLAWYASSAGARVWTVPGGYAFTRAVGDDLVIGPAGGHTPAACVQAVLGASREAGGRTGRLLCGPGPLAELLLSAGFIETDRDTLMASKPGLIDPARYLPHPDLG
jgi:GNAT superfamily N-acetyltransferase